MKVYDDTAHPEGFTDDVVGGAPDTADDYTYDDYGNMTADENKGITNILYNHLNLPVEIVFTGTNKKINYLYDGTGKKVQKTVINDSIVTITDYVSGFHYVKVGSGAKELKFFSHAEGYVNNMVLMGFDNYNYVFNYTDHLGNIRMRYAWDEVAEELKILEENHYYPYGFKHTKYNTDTWEFIKDGYNTGVIIGRPPAPSRPVYQYKYNGQEYQDELGLNMYAMDMRQYDPAIARWVVQDPVVHHNFSPYTAFDNNPVYWADPSGADAMGMGMTIAGTNASRYNEYGLFIPLAERGGEDTGLDFSEGTGISFAGLLGADISKNSNATQRIIDDLTAITGLNLSLNNEHKLEYERDANGKPVVRELNGVKEGSVTARNDLIVMINGPMINVRWTPLQTGTPKGTNLILFNPKQITAIVKGTSSKLDNRTLGFGMTFLHELRHTKSAGGATDQDGTITGQVVPRENIYRRELDNNPTFKKSGAFGQRLSYEGIQSGNVTTLYFNYQTVNSRGQTVNNNANITYITN